MAPWDAIATVLVGWHESGMVEGWFKLLFGTIFSFWITFNVVAGGFLASGSGWRVSIGSGMVAAAALAFASYGRASGKITAGIVVAVPQETVNDRFEKNGQGPMITDPGKKK